MTDRFDVAVVGKGLMGSAVARHLAVSGIKVALIGPNEPEAKKDHNGVFASHYDEGRITRSLDGNADWGLLSHRSISRYAAIEEASGISFFSDVGAIMAGAPDGSGESFIERSEKVGLGLGSDFDVYEEDRLSERFPFLSFSAGTRVLYEGSGAGYLSPRQLVKAQATTADKLGAVMVPEEAVAVREGRTDVKITCSGGTTVTAEKLVVAAGGFSGFRSLLPVAIPMRVFARTIVFFEIADDRAEGFRDMPSIVVDTLENGCDPYILPPVRYPDGKLYLKIGGDPDDVDLTSEADIKDWFRSDGNVHVAGLLTDAVHAVVNDIDPVSVSTGTCVTSFTRSGYPIIDHVSDRIIAVTGGNGKGAKCSDEIGRLGAMVALGKDISQEGYHATFSL